jgi:hypothetical protein
MRRRNCTLSCRSAIGLPCTIVLGLAGSFALGHRSATAQTIDTLALREHTRVLASDSMEGRGAGTRGERRAALYIAGQLARLGLRPGGDDYFQSVPLRRITIEPSTEVAIGAGEHARRFRHGADFVLGSGGPGAFRDFAGEAVFLGTTRHARALDDGALRDRVVVALGTDAADLATLVPRWQAAGVAGVILAIPDAQQFGGLARSRGGERYFVDADVDDPVWQPALPVLIAGPALLDALLPANALPSAARAGSPDVPLALGRAVRLRIAASTEALPAANVAAVLPGSDSALRDEYVAFAAHYDHLGIGEPDERGDSIYNGFFDNAAGVAMALEIARALRAAPPDRSVLFLFFTAEERGLLGSSFYAARPLRPLERTAAVINLDAGAPAAPPVSWRIDGDSTAVGALARAIAIRQGWELRFYPARPISDHWPFARRGVAAIFLVPGNDWEGLGTAEVAALKKRWDHYHAPADEWASGFPFGGLARYAEFALEIGRAAASRTAGPHEKR